jgi:prepilin-type N-terminal cleavage/methylation domain-containing protein
MRRNQGFTVVELMVGMAILGLLAGLLLPGVQAARESARAIQCKNNLHQIALATDLFHDKAVGIGVGAGFTVIRLGCGCTIQIPDGNSGLTGAVGDYGGNHGDLSPGAFGLPTDFYFGGNGTGVIISSRADCLKGVPTNWIDRLSKKDVIDGTSLTILTGEMHVPLGKIGQSPQDAFIFNGNEFSSSTRIGGPTLPIVQNLRSEGNSLVSWGSWHRGICHFAMCDGSTKSINNMIDTDLLGHLCNRADGQIAEVAP